MHGPTLAYLRDQFAKYYERTTLVPPPSTEQREWGVIPWSQGKTQMHRHQSFASQQEINGRISRTVPRHAYFSAGYYENPSAQSMDNKNWKEADLIFDIDGPHLERVNDETPYVKLLSAAKEEMKKLVEVLQRDFAFEDITITFSGGKGYHVHVRDDEIRELGRDARMEIVDYIDFEDLDVDQVLEQSKVGATSYRFDLEGDLNTRLYESFVEYLDRLAEMPDEEAISELNSLPNIGEKRARVGHKLLIENRHKVKDKTVKIETATREILKQFINTVGEYECTSKIDAPVTKDTHRLIRFPGSLHGGTGLRVTEFDADEIGSFDPLTDALPDYGKHSVEASVVEDCTPRLRGSRYEFEAGGRYDVPAYLAVFLAANNFATVVGEQYELRWEETRQFLEA